MFRSVLLCLALAPKAIALDSTFLQSLIDLSMCKIGVTVPGLRSEAFLFAVDNLLPPGSNDEDNKLLSMTVAGQNSVLLIEIPADVGVAVYNGFESGDFLLWMPPGSDEIPAEYEGNTDQANMTFSATATELAQEDCGQDFFLEGQCQLRFEYYADGKTWDIIEPPFESFDDPYDPRIRPWYMTAVAENQNVWSEPYADFDTGESFISPSVLLKNQAGDLVGVAAGDVVLTTVAMLFETAAKDVGASAIYVMDSSKQHLLVLSSIPGSAFDKEGAQVPALTSDNVIIKESASLVKKKQADGEVFVGQVDGQPAFIQAISISEIETLPFKDGVSWIYVIVAPAVCDKGFVLDSAQAACIPA